MRIVVVPHHLFLPLPRTRPFKPIHTQHVQKHKKNMPVLTNAPDTMRTSHSMYGG